MNEQKQERSIDSLRDEYADVCQNIRHYSNLRFTIFTVYFAVIGGIAVLAFTHGQFTPFASTAAKAVGLLTTIIFWYYQERATQFYEYFGDVGVELERLLGYKQLSSRPIPKPRFLYVETVTRVFFFLLALFWGYAILV